MAPNRSVPQGTFVVLAIIAFGLIGGDRVFRWTRDIGNGENGNGGSGEEGGVFE